jgi:hypothetical protein
MDPEKMNELALKALADAIAKLPAKPTVKSGFKTTEFWVTNLASVGAILASVAGFLPPQYAALATALAGGLYAVSRGLAKK